MFFFLYFYKLPDNDKLLKRQARFGVVSNSNTEVDLKKQKRAERFGTSITAVDSGDEQKRKRAERFGLAWMFFLKFINWRIIIETQTTITKFRFKVFFSLPKKNTTLCVIYIGRVPYFAREHNFLVSKMNVVLEDMKKIEDIA